ncbi:MAG: succinate dehydrogenase/fumarate reductase flavoprotein subunit, partial [Thiotrichales bacterium]|nr:succinate dehydrogenase/fumarate reductase flavoprotein subunit [Thiotrichales bacterium]
QAGCGVFRNEESMQSLLKELEVLQDRLELVRLHDHSNAFNLERLEAFELENLMGLATATVYSALARTESRGAHSRVDFTERDDENWMKHSLYFLQNHQLRYKPVNIKPLTVETFPPKARVY